MYSEVLDGYLFPIIDSEEVEEEELEDSRIYNLTTESATFSGLHCLTHNTEATAGRFDFVTGGGKPFKRVGPGRSGFSVVYGVRRSNFHEQFHFYEDPALQLRLGGRWTFRILRLGGREDIPEVTRWLMRRADDPRPFVFRNDFDTERDQARREKTDMIWNLEAVKTLEDMGYFKMHGIEDALQEFKESDRAKAPPRGGVVRFRPRGPRPKTPPPDIFGD